MIWLVERKTLLAWRVAQFWMLLIILALEIVQLSGYYAYYWEHPASDQTRIWIFEGISLAIMGYILVNFNRRWNDGKFREDMILDWILLIIWSLQGYLNVGPAIFGDGLDCNMTTSIERSRCHLFIVNTILSSVMVFGIIVTLILSVISWRNRRLILPTSSRGYQKHGRSKSSYKVQKGLLNNGEPVLFFYSKNMPHNSFYKENSKLRNSIIKTSESSSPVNISIPEPEIAATARNSKDIPSFSVNEEKNDDSTLKY